MAEAQKIEDKKEKIENTGQEADGPVAEVPKELSSVEQSLIYHQAVDAIRTCFDPEIPVNIYELGLIYEVKVAADGGVLVVMTLTTPHCPAAQTLPKDVETRVRGVHGVTNARVQVVWDPPWNQSMMSEVARLELGM